MKKFLLVIIAISVMATMLSGCETEASRVSHNVSQEADNFNVVRRLVVVNARTDKPFIEIVGKFSFTLETNRIILVVETEDGVYKKHSVGLNEWSLWDVEDLSGADVDKYHYEVNFLPEMINPITFKSKD